MREADGGDAAHGAGLGCLQRQDQAPHGARHAPMARSHPLPPPQHQARFEARRSYQDGRSGRREQPTDKKHTLSLSLFNGFLFL